MRYRTAYFPVLVRKGEVLLRLFGLILPRSVDFLDGCCDDGVAGVTFALAAFCTLTCHPAGLVKSWRICQPHREGKAAGLVLCKTAVFCSAKSPVPAFRLQLLEAAADQ